MFSDEQLLKISNGFLQSSLFLQKYSSNPDLLIKKIKSIFSTVNIRENMNLFVSISVYLTELLDDSKIKMNEIMEAVPATIRKEFKSVYDGIIEQGLEQGLDQRGIQDVLRGVEKGHSLDIICDITGFSLDRVKKIISDNK